MNKILFKILYCNFLYKRFLGLRWYGNLLERLL